MNLETNESKLPNRHTIRLPKYDYSTDGWYFITICTHGKQCLFGRIIDGKMQLSEYGLVVQECWHDLVHHYSNIILHDFCIMPNHFHGIIEIDNASVGSVLRPDLKAGLSFAPIAETGCYHGLPEIVRSFKSFSTRKINCLRHVSRMAVWQRNYFEHVIRSEKSYYTLVNYIRTNALRWELDTLNNMG